LCIVCLSFQFFSYNSLAYSSDELCYDEPIDIKISDKNKSKIISIENTSCKPITVKLHGMPFEIKLWYSTYLNIAEVEYIDYNLQQLKDICKIFSDLDEITINADEYYCKK